MEKIIKKIKENKTLFILLTIIILIFIFTFPNFLNNFYKMGYGHAFSNIMVEKNLSWWEMSEIERQPYIQELNMKGIESATFMTLGQYIPLCLFFLTAIGSITNFLSDNLRKKLSYIFLATWLFGVFFLSLGVQYWGPAPQFPGSLIPVAIIYLFIAAFFGIVIDIGQRIKRKINSKKDKNNNK